MRVLPTREVILKMRVSVSHEMGYGLGEPSASWVVIQETQTGISVG